MVTYAGHIFKSAEFVIQPLTMKDFKDTCISQAKSAPGLDGWAAADLALFSDEAFQVVVDLLNHIEEGNIKWPKHMLETRAVLLPKDPNDVSNPLAQRILKITSCYYRRWAGTRLKNIEDWVELWDDPALHVIGGKGALDAWFNKALSIEAAKLEGIHIAGGSVDVYKCFDQVNRELLFLLAQQAGMPMRILRPYFDYIDQIEVRYQIGKYIGKPHRERCSIPQGCPFSMALIALFMRVWVSKMRSIDVEPRCLADDLMFTATGLGHVHRTADAMIVSRNFFKHMGARVADNKCFLFASSPHSSKLLKDVKWDHTNLTIPITNNFRDLGTHLNLTRSTNGSTLTARMKKGITMCNRLARLPLTQQIKENIVRANILPASLYGCEAAHVCESTLQSLRTAIARAIGPHSAKRSLDLTFSLTCASKDLDPETYILYNRIAAIRREIVKRPESKKRLIQNITLYHNMMDSEETVQGPMGHLIEQCKKHNITLGTDLNIHATNETPIALMIIPWQHLKKAIYAIAARTRARNTDHVRTFHGRVGEIDDLILNKTLNKFGTKERNAFRYVASGAFWNEKQLADIGQGGGFCPHCLTTYTNKHHTLWHCPVINKHRKHCELNDIDADALPDCIKVGLPPAMHARHNTPYWGDDLHNYEGNSIITKRAIGIPTSSQWCYGASLDNNNLCNATNTSREDLAKLSARQAFAKLKPIQTVGHIPLVYKCTLKPPEQINVYSDGSWQNPLTYHFALGGAGVWWPGRKHWLNNAEDELAIIEKHDDGVRLYTPIGGFSGSSTRTELAAAILAISSNGPVHLGTDSKAFVLRANFILDLIRQNKLPKVRWGLMSDGDLWEHFFKVARAKSPEAIRITWVKGHATQEHINRGITTQTHLEGNDTADKTADQGVAQHGEQTTHFATVYSKRHHWYTKFFGQVATHITEAYLINRELLRIKQGKIDATTDAHAQKHHYEPLQYASFEDTTALNFRSSINRYKDIIQDNPNITRVERFLRNLFITKRTGAERGITWLELFILYRTQGYPKPIKDSTTKAKTNIAMYHQFDTFKTMVRKVVDRACLDIDQHDLFKPSKVITENLNGVGLSGKHPAVSFNVYIDVPTAMHIAGKLLTLGACYKKTDISAFLTSGIALPNAPYNLKGKHKWDATTPIQQPDTSPLPSPHDNQAGRVGMAHITCGKCNQDNPAHRFPICSDNLDHKIKCISCNSTTAVRHWKCKCGIQWHLCHIHQPQSLQHKRKAEQSIKAMAPTHVAKKRIPPECLLDKELKQDSKDAKRKFEDGLSDLNKRAKMSSGSSKRLTTGMLPESLRVKFPRLQYSSS
jgi:ribonuclease HI